MSIGDGAAEHRRRGSARCSGTGPGGSRLLTGPPRSHDRFAEGRRRRGVAGGATFGTAAMGFLPARPAAVAGVGATVERGAALPTLQSMSGHNGMLWLFVTASNPRCDGAVNGGITFHLQVTAAYWIPDSLPSKRFTCRKPGLGD